MDDISSTSKQVEVMEAKLKNKLDEVLPEKNIKTSNNDKPFITADLKHLDRRKKREYRKNGQSTKYKQLKQKFDRKYLKAAEKYIIKNVTELKQADPGKAYSILKRMGAQPGDCDDQGSFTLLNHADNNLSTEESIEQIADYFARISQEYPPLNIELLPQDVKDKLNRPIGPDDLPQLSDYDIYEQIIKSRKTKSGVPGDLPKEIVDSFPEELATPVSKIFRNMLATYSWPASWKTEYGIPLKKVQNPKSEDELRIISLTSFFSKTCENFVIKWLMEYVGDKIDMKQFGGQKGNSITHYIIEFVNFILYNRDMTNPHAVLALMVDFRKAFNRQNHNILVTILSKMGVPGWLLQIVISFLSDRELIVKYKDGQSGRKYLPGGSPQGTRLGMFLFLILINFAGLDFEEMDYNIGKLVTKPLHKRIPMDKIHMKYVDDLSLAVSLNLKDNLVPNPEVNPQRPLSYHERTQHILPGSRNMVQQEFDKLKEFAAQHEMIINGEKTKAMLFNSARKWDFTPQIVNESGEFLEVVEELKILGVVVSSNMTWHNNTSYICGKGYARMWMLRNLKRLGTSNEELVDVYYKQCRSVLELAVPAWTPALTSSESNQIERVQKTACAIILGEKYTSYKRALKILNMKTLQVRRSELCLSFAKKAMKSDKFSSWFSFSTINYDKTRSEKDILTLVKTRTDKYKKSPIPYLTNILNDHLKSKNRQNKPKT